MSVKEKALNQALQLLRAIGAQFAVVVDGAKHGELQIIEPSQGARKKRNPVAYQWHTIYGPWLDSAGEGSVFTHKCESAEAAESLRGSVSSQIKRKFGAGMTAISQDGGEHVVEALIVKTAQPNGAAH